MHRYMNIIAKPATTGILGLSNTIRLATANIRESGNTKR